MSIIPTPAPMQHPTWCDRRHPDNWPVHETQIGATLELSHELAYSIRLQRVEADDAVTEVLLVRHGAGGTSVTRLSIVEGGILRDLLIEGLDVLAAEVGR